MALSRTPGRSRFARSVVGIGLVAPALIVSPGRQSPGRFLFARTRGLLGRGTAESPSPRDHRDLLLRGDPAKKRLSIGMAIPVLTIGDDSWSFCDIRRRTRFAGSPDGYRECQVRPYVASEPGWGWGNSSRGFLNSAPRGCSPLEGTGVRCAQRPSRGNRIVTVHSAGAQRSRLRSSRRFETGARSPPPPETGAGRIASGTFGNRFDPPRAGGEADGPARRRGRRSFRGIP